MKVRRTNNDYTKINDIQFFLESLDLHHFEKIFVTDKSFESALDKNTLHIIFEDSIEIDILINMLENCRDDIKQATGVKFIETKGE